MKINKIVQRGGKIDDIGNVKDVDNRERIASPFTHELIVTPTLILKGYKMIAHSDDALGVDYAVPEFVGRKLTEKEIDPRSGLGFVILSKEILNITRWDDKCPLVLINDVYEFDREDESLSKTRKVDIRDVGSYCVWELGIVNHERLAWMKYLDSKKTTKDKLDYLEDTIRGELR